MDYAKYQDYLNTTPGLLRVVKGVACDLCAPVIPITWTFGRPWLCEGHARELGLLW